MLLLFLSGCGSANNSSAQSSTTSTEKTVASSTSDNRDAKDITFLKTNPTSEWNCNMYGGLRIRYSLTPENALVSSVTWTSSNETVATVSSGGTIQRGTTAGKTTITATLTNGIQKSFEFELKTVATIDNRLHVGDLVQCDSYKRVRIHHLSDLTYGWYYSKETYKYNSRLYFSCEGEVVSDTDGDNKSKMDYLLRLALIDKDGITIDTELVLTEAVMKGDKYKIEETFFKDAPLSGAPYTIRVTQYSD